MQGSPLCGSEPDTELCLATQLGLPSSGSSIGIDTRTNTRTGAGIKLKLWLRGHAFAVCRPVANASSSPRASGGRPSLRPARAIAGMSRG